MIISRHDRATYVIAALAGVVAAVLVVRPILLHPGLPAYQHDWSLPFSASAFRGAFIGHFSSWDTSGVGTPNGFASANPVYAFISLLGVLFSPILAGKVLLVLCVAAAAVTMAQCVRAIGLSATASGLAAVAYVCSPALFNKIAAGHVGFWIAYALFPLVVTTARGAALGEVRSVAALVLAVGASVVQPQFVVFDVVAALIAGVGFGGLRGIAVGTIAAAAALVMELPTMYSLRNAADTIVNQVPAPLASWESLQSTAPVDAVQLNHYIIPYFETAVGYYGWLSLIPATAALAGAVRRIRSRCAMVAIAFALVGFIIVTGTKGPFGLLWSWAFLHVRAFSVIRELYNAATLMAFAISMGVALLTDRQSPVFRVVLAAAVLCAFSVQLTGGLGRVVSNVTLPDFVAKDREQIATLPPGRVLPLPLVTPMRYRHAGVGGIDTFAIAVADRDHSSATAYPTSFPLLQLAAARTIETPRWKALARNANLVAVVRRPGLATVDPQLLKEHTVGAIAQPPYGVAPLSPGGLVTVAIRVALAGPAFPDSSSPDLVTLSSEQGPLPNSAGNPQVVTPSANRLVDDPRSAWVDAQRWIGLAPDWSAATSGGVLTQSNAPLTLQLAGLSAPSVMISTSGEASLDCGNSKYTVTKTSVRWVALGRCSMLMVRSRKGVTAVYRAASGAAAIPSGTLSSALVDDIRRPFPWEVNARIRASAQHPVVVVFAEQFSSGWELHGARVLWHGMANGFANAWEIDPPEGTVTFVYAPQNLVSALSIVSDLSYTLMACAFVVLTIRRTSSDGSRA